MITLGEHTDPPVGGISCFDDVLLTIGKYCSIASGLKIISGQHPIVEHPNAVSQYPFADHGWGDYWNSKMDGFVIIGNDVWICEDVTILEGITIGSGSVIASKSVVTRNIGPYTIYAGNPARLRKFRFAPPQVDMLMNIRWWDWPTEKVREAIPSMKNIDTFLTKYAKID